MTLNVEYNQLDPLLRDTINKDGDVNDATGYPPPLSGPSPRPAGSAADRRDTEPAVRPTAAGVAQRPSRSERRYRGTTPGRLSAVLRSEAAIRRDARNQKSASPPRPTVSAAASLLGAPTHKMDPRGEGAWRELSPPPAASLGFPGSADGGRVGGEAAGTGFPGGPERRAGARQVLPLPG